MSDNSEQTDDVELASAENRRETRRGQGRGQGQGRGPPEKCECPDGTDASGKYDFECVENDEDGECTDYDFVLSDGDDVVNITGWDTKEDEEDEPISVDYDTADGYTVTYVCAFGGRDTAEDDDPDGSFDAELENPGGRQAAISNITFCVTAD